MKLKRNLNNAEAGGNGGQQQESFFGNVDLNDIEIVRNGEESPFKAEAEKKEGEEEKKAGDEEQEGQEAAAAGEKKEGENTEKKEGEEADGQDGGEPGDDVDEKDELPALEDSVLDQSETTWEDMAKHYELPDDVDANLTGQDRFDAQFKKRLDNEYQRGMTDAIRADVQKFEPQSQAYFEALNGGMKHDEVVLGHAAFYKAAAKNDKDVVSDYMKLVQKQDEGLIADAIETLEANGTLSLEAGKIRTALYEAGDNIINQNVEKFSGQYVAEKKRIQEQSDRENQAVIAELKKVTKFMGGDVTDAHHKVLIKQWEAGQWRNKMANDPKAVADFIYWNSFGENRVAKMKESANRDAKKETFNKLSNSKTRQSGSQVQQQQSAAGFSEWEVVKNAKDVRVEYGR